MHFVRIAYAEVGGRKMLSFREMAYVIAVGTICFLSCIFKTAYILQGGFAGLVYIYYTSTILLFGCAALIFAFIRQKCLSYEKSPDRDVFLTVKKLKNISEIIYLTVILFFISTLFDIFNANYIGKIYRNPMHLFTSFPFWESIMGLFVIVFGLKAYFRYFETNKLFSALEFENFRKPPKAGTDGWYPTIEEYEKHEAYRSGSEHNTIFDTETTGGEEQERFIRENSVEEELVERTLTGADSDGKPKRSISAGFDFTTAPIPDNELKVCPLCGSLNTSDDIECSFCGGNLKQ